ncbi:putative ABC transporter ATP-binding protein [Arthrobacter crystallopoietes BAB-32]|uniref:Putative ABC transporter ATP-binding protein n=1 Tax=Arthrobacter crystallopoietes BAB-32 TaxID=1246476 RepID=N1V1A5_9MICC|nr:ABC transporter ATP-binding protein [Arthrobacter crystallopoietes]EMY33847.1 putative ABC transporter ATP-binding protein [Arthrobacter crystallopoietes BAB-32]
MISGSGISYAYGSHNVLGGVDLQARHGEVLGLVGPNGSGKSTLLRIIYGSLKPRTGTVLLDHKELHRLNARELARTLSVVVQEPPVDLPLLVSDMVLLGRTPHRSGLGRPSARDEQAAAAALSRVGMLDLADQSFDQLSGGERQRVLIARALAQEATHMLLDEPTNHLDIRYQHEILELVRDLATNSNHAIAVVLHDLNLAATYCDRLLLLDHGRIAVAGTPSEVLVRENLEPVYRIGVRRIELDDGFQLAFRPTAASTVGEYAPDRG